MHELKQFIESFPPGVFPLMAGAFGLVSLQTRIHKWLSVQSPRIKVTISLVLGSMLVVIPHWIGILQGNKNLLGAYGAEVLTVMNYAYNWLLREKPLIDTDLGVVPASAVIPDPLPISVVSPAEDTAANFQAKS